MRLVNQVAMVSESPAVPLGELAVVSAAIQKQCVRDLERFWDVSATVDAFASLSDVPPGYWPVIIRDDIDRPETGVHLDDNGQPMALVVADENWTVTASHETLEMLVDPFGNRLVAGDSPMPEQGRVEFLVEISDPSGDPNLAYTCNGVRVSDFYTPRYFDPLPTSGVQYSCTGALTRPREVLFGGYLTWHEPVLDEWWQLLWFEGNAPRTRRIGRIDTSAGAIRARIDPSTERYRRELGVGKREKGSGAAPPLVKPRVVEASRAKADSWRTCVDRIRGGRARS